MNTASVPRPELLAPAGNLEKLRTSLLYGADAVYLGGPSLNLRAGTQGFDQSVLDRGLALAHAWGARVYYCLNAFASEQDLSAVQDALDMLRSRPINGMIVADPGVFRLARQELPHVPIHVSTQANVSNSAAVAFWAGLGAKRVNLAREMNLRDIRAVAQTSPGMELEIFVHGAMCLALSGRCSLSAYLNDRSANKGQCTQACRFQYRPVAMALEEQLRPGEVLWEAMEQQGFTALFSPRDLCLIKYLPWLCRNAVSAVKIEGRMRSSAYAALVCDVYSTALHDLAQGRFRPRTYLLELCTTLHRPLDTGFFLPGAPARTARTWDCTGSRPMVARILERTGNDAWLVQVLDRWDAAQPVDLVLPGLRRPAVAPVDYGLEDGHGGLLAQVHPGQRAVLRTGHPECAPDIFLRQERLT